MKKTLFNLALLSPLFCLSVLGGHGGDAATDVFSVPGQYSTIQAAIDAADGGGTIIQIAPGDYYEQLLISNKANLTLAGQPGTVLHATADLTQTLRRWTATRAVVGIVRSHASLVGLTIDGDQQGGAYSDGGLQGIFCLSSGSRIEDCTLRGFRGDSLEVYSSARALVVWNPESAGAPGIEVQILSNRFTDNETSIALAGDDQVNPTKLRTTFTVEGNTIRGFGPAAIAVDGAVVYTGAGGVFRGNTITDHQYTGAGNPYSSGINAFDGSGDLRNPAQFIPLHPIRFEGNTFRNNNDHLVLLNAPNSEVLNNIFEGSGPGEPRWGALSISGTGIRIENNDFSNVSTGIHLFGNDHYFDGWPSVRLASNPILIANWFSNVPNPVQIQPGATGVDQQRTQAPPFQPEFQSIIKDIGSIRTRLRAWHGQPLAIETSGDFVNWTRVHTNSMSSPVVEYLDANPNGSLRFYRARNQ